MKKLSLLLAVLTLGFASTSSATLLEARLTYGGLLSTPALGDFAGTNTPPAAAANYGVGGDLLVFIPLTGFGVGFRHEDLGMNAGTGSISASMKVGRNAAIVTYRFIDTILHVGLLGTVGISHDKTLQITDSTSGSTTYKWSADSASSYSLGLDVNVSLIAFLVGAEAGYESLKWTHATDSTGNSTKTPDLDLSGGYGKVYVGLSF